jgi:hypothetical protein|tara:strand:- start:276 stop:539 length:264 start_codon:yes stop_codon:yes gene_type:complete
MIIKQKRFLIKPNSYIIDLFTVDFITWKENEKEEGTYWTKLHIGTKETRYVCKDAWELKRIIELWCEIHGKEVMVTIEELIGEEKWD